MDYSALKLEVFDLLKHNGWAPDAQIDLGALVNQALREWSWEAEYKTAEETFPTVAGTAEYTLTTPPDWKLVRDLYYGTTVALCLSSEDEERRKNPLWRMAERNTPEVFWMPSPNVLRLYPTPAAVATVTVRGVTADDDLSASADTPDCPAHYHRLIALLAAFRHVERYFRGDDLKRAAGWYADAMAGASRCALDLASQNAPALQRNVRQRPARRITLGYGGGYE